MAAIRFAQHADITFRLGRLEALENGGRDDTAIDNAPPEAISRT